MRFNRSQQIIFIYLILSLTITITGVDFSYIPFSFFIVWLIHLIYSIGSGFLVRHIFILFLAVQYCLGTTLAYEFDTESIYRMVIPMNEYFAFAFTGVLFFSFALLIGTNNNNEDLTFKKIILASSIELYSDKVLITIMFFSLLSEIFQFSGPESLNFVFYIFFSLKYAYVCFQIITKPKINYLYIGLPILFLVIQTLQTAMFHDLVTWSIFWGLSACIRIKPKIRTIILSLIGFTFFIILIQITKKTYRAIAWGASNTEEVAGVGVYGETVLNKSNDLLESNELTENIVRINQGWILATVIEYVPKQIEHEGFELINKYIEAAFLPRFLAPDKLTAGNKTIFKKYTGIQLQQNTSMGLGILADAWIAFGLVGGWIVLFIYGLIINGSLKLFQKMLTKFPILYFFLPVIYIYPIRPDCETQTAFGHLVKTFVFLIIMAYLFMPKIKIRTS